MGYGDGISSQGSHSGVWVRCVGVFWTRTAGEAGKAGVKDRVTDFIEVVRTCGKNEEADLMHKSRTDV